MPFGGMLGSTFNFVFENQLENLQDGDRFYYLARTAGLNFVNELEDNSFAKLIMANTDATHLPGRRLPTPADTSKRSIGVDSFAKHDYVLDVDRPSRLDGATGPVDDDAALNAIRHHQGAPRRPATLPGRTPTILHYTGDDHVVLGGTEGNDILIAGDGDDTHLGRRRQRPDRWRLRRRPAHRRRRRRHHHRHWATTTTSRAATATTSSKAATDSTT